MTAALSIMGGIIGAGLLVYLFYMLFESDKLLNGKLIFIK